MPIPQEPDAHPTRSSPHELHTPERMNILLSPHPTPYPLHPIFRLGTMSCAHNEVMKIPNLQPYFQDSRP